MTVKLSKKYWENKHKRKIANTEEIICVNLNKLFYYFLINMEIHIECSNY